MAYFIHNKYDSNSSAKVTHVSGTSYTYKEDPSITVIDFFGNMEAGVNTYRNLDTTYMGIKPVDELVYTTIDEDSLIGNGQTTDGSSNLEYATGVLPIVEKLQELMGQASDTGGSENVGTIMAKLNAILKDVKTTDMIVYRGITDTSVANSNSGSKAAVMVNLPTPINVSKSFVIAHGFGMSASNYSDTDKYNDEYYFPAAIINSPTQITIIGGDYYYDSSSSSSRVQYIKVTWQIIEFK